MKFYPEQTIEKTIIILCGRIRDITEQNPNPNPCNYVDEIATLTNAVSGLITSLAITKEETAQDKTVSDETFKARMEELFKLVNAETNSKKIHEHLLQVLKKIFD